MNVELALAAIEDAKAHPENFDMSTWFDSREHEIVKDGPDFAPPCGTTACYAGFAALRAAPVGSVICGGFFFPPGVPRGDGRGIFVENYAIRALGITTDQARAIFRLSNIGEVEAAVTYLADSPDTPGGTLWQMFHVVPPGEFELDDDWLDDRDGL
jgi:hypothetical protein